MERLRLLVIGASVFQRNSQGELTSKQLVVDYIQGFTDYFDKVIWAAKLYEGRAHTQAIVDKHKITPVILIGRPKGLFSDYQKLRQLITPNTIIFLHLPNPWITPLVLALKRKARAMFVYVAGDYVRHSEISKHTRGRVYSWLYRFIYELPIRFADGVIVRGELLKERVRTLNRNVLNTVPIGLTTALYQRKKSPLSDSFVRILYVGKLVKGKGVEILLKAFARLCSRLSKKEISLTIVGAGPEEESLRSLCLSMGISQKVQFKGFIDDKRELSKLYARSDILVVPSTSYPEGVPRVIDEALLHGTPVIASSLETIRREFAGGEGVFVPPGSVEALEDAVFRMISDQEFRSRVLMAIEKRISQPKKWHSASEQHSDFILRSTVDARRRLYESSEYIIPRKARAHRRRIEDPYLLSLFSGRRVLELGCGANPQDHLGSEYIGVDISERALKERRGRGERVQADCSSLPFKDESFDAVVTVALLEHVPEPEMVLREIIRVLRPGGIVLHSDAWNVPPWRRLGLTGKQQEGLKFWKKVLRVAILVLESLPFRALRIVPVRLRNELRRGRFLYYRRIKSNYNLPEVSDADACSSIDSHSVILFYKARGFELIKPKDKFLQRVLHRGMVIVRKRP